MKKLIIFGYFLFFVGLLNAQNINGVWEGRIIRPTDFRNESGTIYKQSDCKIILTQEGNSLASIFTIKDSIGDTEQILETGMTGFLPRVKKNSFFELNRDPRIDKYISANKDIFNLTAYTNFISANQIEKDGRIFLVGSYYCLLNNITYGPFTYGYFIVEKTDKKLSDKHKKILGNPELNYNPAARSNTKISEYKDITYAEKYILSLALAYNKGRIIPE